MSGGFTLPWFIWPLLPYVVSPVVALLGFTIGVALAARGGGRPLRLALGGALGSQLLPWLGWLGADVVGSPSTGTGLVFLALLGTSVAIAVIAARRSRRY